jgi:prolipoprotein diacylglyceryltransferase
MFATYLIYYSIGRIWVENLRIDPSEILFGLRINVWSGILGTIAGIAIIYLSSRKSPEPDESPYRANAIESSSK